MLTVAGKAGAWRGLSIRRQEKPRRFAQAR